MRFTGANRGILHQMRTGKGWLWSSAVLAPDKIGAIIYSNLASANKSEALAVGAVISFGNRRCSMGLLYSAQKVPSST